MSIRQNTNTQRKAKQTVQLKLDKDGRYNLPFDVLSNLKVTLPAGFEDLNQNLYIVFTTSGGTLVGLSEKLINLKPITDVTQLYGIRGLIHGATKAQDSAETTLLMEHLIERCDIPAAEISPGGNFRVEMLSHVTHWQNLKASEDLVNKNVATQSVSIKEILSDTIKRLQMVLLTRVKDTCSNNRNREELRTQLVAEGTCNYFWTRLVANRLTHPTSLDLEYLIYPTKVENGLKLTTLEFMDKVVRSTLKLTELNGLPYAWMSNPNFAEVVALVPPKDEKELLRYNKFQWIMTPEISRRDAVSTRKYQPRLDRSKSAFLTSLNNLLIQSYMGIPPLGVSQRSLIEISLKSTKLDDAHPTKNIVTQFTDALPADDNYLAVWTVKDGLRTIFNLIGGYPAPMRTLLISESKAVALLPRVEPKKVNLFRKVDDVSYASLKRDVKALGDLASKDKDSNVRIYGVIGKAMKKLSNEMTKKDHPLHPIKDRVENFLKQFSNPEFQKAAVRNLRSAADQLSANIGEGYVVSDSEDEFDEDEE